MVRKLLPQSPFTLLKIGNFKEPLFISVVSIDIYHIRNKLRNLKYFINFHFKNKSLHTKIHVYEKFLPKINEDDSILQFYKSL